MHELHRVRQDVKKRTARVTSKQYLTPRMLRIELQSDELPDSNSPAPDDHIKIFREG